MRSSHHIIAAKTEINKMRKICSTQKLNENGVLMFDHYATEEE